MPFAQEIEAARRAAVQSAELALRLHKAGLSYENKPDASPVTRADRECERLIAGLIETEFPADGILGEEGAAKVSSNGRRWIIDPIDGTRDFVRGNPLWAVLIALEEHGEVKAGVAHLPVLGATYWAGRGGGSFRNDAAIRVSTIETPREAVLSVNSLNRIEPFGFSRKLIPWMQQFWAFRCLGGTPDAMLLASGQLEAWIEPKVAPWDLAAAQVILEEAGAVFFDFRGERTIYSGCAAACVPALVPELRRFLQSDV